jgi:hypothetical protein
MLGNYLIIEYWVGDAGVTDFSKAPTGSSLRTIFIVVIPKSADLCISCKFHPVDYFMPRKDL